jgi:hypothetical protein
VCNDDVEVQNSLLMSSFLLPVDFIRFFQSFFLPSSAITLYPLNLPLFFSLPFLLQLPPFLSSTYFSPSIQHLQRHDVLYRVLFRQAAAILGRGSYHRKTFPIQKNKMK